MLPSRSAAQASSEMSWLSSAIEVLPKRLFFGSFRFLPPESSSVHLFCIDDSLVYEPFYAVCLLPPITDAFPHAFEGLWPSQPRLPVRRTLHLNLKPSTPFKPFNPTPFTSCQTSARVDVLHRYRYCQMLKEKLANEQHKDKKLIHYCNRSFVFIVLSSSSLRIAFTPCSATASTAQTASF